MKIKFGTDGWRGIIAQDYTFENLARVTDATIQWIQETAQQQGQLPSVMLGYDCRFNGQLFAEAVAQRMSAAGIKVFISPNFVSTPMVSLATAQRQCTAGVVITASHNPASYSGFKIKRHFGGPAFPATIATIESYIPDYPKLLASLPHTQSIEYYDMEALYLNHLKQNFDLERIKQSGFKIGYDAMYGAGQRVLKRILPETYTLHCEHNPLFGGTPPEPIARNLQPFAQFIREHQLAFGLATDGDADRIGLFNENAEFVDSHHILLLLIHYLHKYKKWQGKVICTFSCSAKIKALCNKYNLDLEVTKIGFKYIGEIMAAEDVLVGGEESGGIAVKGHIPERDGIYVGLMILEMMAHTGKSLTKLIAEVYEVVGRFCVDRVDLHIEESIKQSVISNCPNYSAFGDYKVQKIENLDGYKYHLGDESWVMIRPSGTEPVLRVYAESQTPAQVESIIQATVNSILV